MELLQWNIGSKAGNMDKHIKKNSEDFPAVFCF